HHGRAVVRRGRAGVRDPDQQLGDGIVIRHAHRDPVPWETVAWTGREGDQLVTRDLDDEVIASAPLPPPLPPAQTAAAVALALAVVEREDDISPDVDALAGVVAAGAAAGAALLPTPTPDPEEP